MPTYGWGDQWGEFGWGGTTSTGDISYVGNVSFSLSASALSTIRPVVASSVVLINSADSRAEYLGQSNSAVSLLPSCTKTLDAIAQANCAFSLTPTNLNKTSLATDGVDMTFANSYTKRIKPLVSASAVFTPSSDSRITIGVIGSISVYFVPSHTKVAGFKKLGNVSFEIIPNSKDRGWRIRDRGQSLFICQQRASSIWSRRIRPSTIFAEV